MVALYFQSNFQVETISVLYYWLLKLYKSYNYYNKTCTITKKIVQNIYKDCNPFNHLFTKYTVGINYQSLKKLERQVGYVEGLLERVVKAKKRVSGHFFRKPLLFKKIADGFLSVQMQLRVLFLIVKVEIPATKIFNMEFGPSVFIG